MHRSSKFRGNRTIWRCRAEKHFWKMASVRWPVDLRNFDVNYYQNGGLPMYLRVLCTNTQTDCKDRAGRTIKTLQLLVLNYYLLTFLRGGEKLPQKSRLSSKLSLQSL